MKNWKNGDYEIEKVVYELEYKYSRANLSASALKGRDSAIFALVDSVAKELGFCMGLAHLELTLTGTPDGPGFDDDYDDEWEDDDSHGDEEREENWSFGDIDERTVSVTNLVDAKGKQIAPNVDFDDETEAIPSGFVEEIEAGRHDRQEYEGYQGNVGDSSPLRLRLREYWLT
jgi:hypothetical protein